MTDVAHTVEVLMTDGTAENLWAARHGGGEGTPLAAGRRSHDRLHGRILD